MNNGLEIILQNWSFTTVNLRNTDLKSEAAQRVCVFLELAYLFLTRYTTLAGCGLGKANSRGPSIVVVCANGAPWCSEYCSSVWVPLLLPGSLLVSPFLPFKLHFIFPSYSLLTAAFIWTVYTSIYSFI